MLLLPFLEETFDRCPAVPRPTSGKFANDSLKLSASATALLFKFSRKMNEEARFPGGLLPLWQIAGLKDLGLNSGNRFSKRVLLTDLVIHQPGVSLKGPSFGIWFIPRDQRIKSGRQEFLNILHSSLTPGAPGELKAERVFRSSQVGSQRNVSGPSKLPSDLERGEEDGEILKMGILSCQHPKTSRLQAGPTVHTIVYHRLVVRKLAVWVIWVISSFVCLIF